MGWQGCGIRAARGGRAPPGPFVSPHLPDLPTAARPDCLPFFHIICMATACSGILIIPTSFCRVTLPWEVRWRTSTWPATGEEQLSGGVNPKQTKIFLSAAQPSCESVVVVSSQLRATQCVGNVDALKGVSGK